VKLLRLGKKVVKPLANSAACGAYGFDNLSGLQAI
jgi:hypothetical protein